MNKIVSRIETDMKVDCILKNFMVGMELESKHGSLAGQALDMMLKLVAPEYSHKQWNYHRLYVNFLEQKNVENVLFSYKDQRFGCLSRAAATLLFNYDWLELFLNQNPQINNRLACLVRELLELPYIKTVFAVFATLGIHIVGPFYCRTIEKGATHTGLKNFYKDLHSSMDKCVSEQFFSFSGPEFLGVSEELFEGIKKSYGVSVLKSVTDVAMDCLNDSVMLVTLIVPELRTVLARLGVGD